MSAARCPQCGRDADFVETFRGARSCCHPFHPSPKMENSIWDDAAEYLAERDAMRALLTEAADMIEGDGSSAWPDGKRNEFVRRARTIIGDAK